LETLYTREIDLFENQLSHFVKIIKIIITIPFQKRLIFA
jgi:hypothetical protein